MSLFVHTNDVLLLIEICAVSRHPKKEIGRCFKLIRQSTNPVMTHPVSSTDFMVLINRWTDGDMHEQTGGWMNGQLDRWMDGQINRWMDGQIDGWMDT